MYVWAPDHHKLEGVAASILPVRMLGFEVLNYCIGFIIESECFLVLPAPFVAAVPTGPQIASWTKIAGDLVYYLGAPATGYILN